MTAIGRNSPEFVSAWHTPTSNSVEKFAEAMEYKLSLNRHKGDRSGWLTAEIPVMMKRLYEEMTELLEAIEQGKVPEEVLFEAADTANIAMMIADIYQEHYGNEAVS